MRKQELKEFISGYFPGERKKNKPIKIEQVAFYQDWSPSPAGGLRGKLKRILGSGDNWIEDEVDCEGVLVRHIQKEDEEFQVTLIRPRLKLQFNYDVGSFEYEILERIEGECLQSSMHNYQLCHLGSHVDSVLGYVLDFFDKHVYPLTLIKTLNHTNPEIKDKRQYWYAIMDTQEQLGFNLKLIERRTSDG